MNAYSKRTPMDRLDKRCKWFLKKRFKDRLSKSDKEKFDRKLKEELKLISLYGYEEIFLFASDVKNLFDRCNILCLFGTNLVYSYVAYLLGITQVNPLFFDLHPEILYSYRFNKAPFLTVSVSENNYDKAVWRITNSLTYRDSFLKIGNPVQFDELYKEFSENVYIRWMQISHYDPNGVPYETDIETSFGERILSIYCSPVLNLLELTEREKTDKENRYSSRQLESMVYRYMSPSDLGNQLDDLKKIKEVLHCVIEEEDEEEMEKMREYLLKHIPLRTYRDLCRFIAICQIFPSYESLVKSEWIGKTRFDFTRDQVADYLLNKGIERETAFRIMEDVRKGKCIQEKDKEKLREHKVSFDFIKYCDSQPYLASRGQVIAIMNLMLYTSIGITFFYLD